MISGDLLFVVVFGTFAIVIYGFVIIPMWVRGYKKRRTTKHSSSSQKKPIAKGLSSLRNNN